jgi:putative two-component system response regulator
VHLSGIIHDVGKIGIEDKILRKPAALTDEEYEIMKQHPRKGEHILEAVPLLKQMAGAGLMHHENWDGSGYPDGLRGAAIPIGARILAVVDCYDALTSLRPYREPLSHTAAVDMIAARRGTMYDPAILDAFLRVAQRPRSNDAADTRDFRTAPHHQFQPVRVK